MKNTKRKYLIFAFSALLTMTSCHADPDTISVFPLSNYDQMISHWIKSNDADFDKPVVTTDVQQKWLANFQNHFVGSRSPWSADYVNQILHQASPNDLKTLEEGLFAIFSNQGKPDAKIGYGENFRPYSQDWIDAISKNANAAQLDNLHFDPNQRAITIENLHARILPTDDVYFYSFKLPGEGYPFDNLQISSLWVGTPVYVLGETVDHAWSMVITPDYIGWVKSTGIARTNSAFVDKWESAFKKQSAAITHTETPIMDSQNHFRFSAYVGAVFPSEASADNIKLLIPVADSQRQAEIQTAIVSNNDAAMMPLAATPHHFSDLMSTLIGRPYGWGNMYFYNDCSAELKNLYSSFGIWLPRHSSDQVLAGKMTDMSAEPTKNRIAYLMNKGHRFTTITYIGGHVLMFVGNYANPNSKDHELMPLTYQNLWGLSPSPSTRRAVVGKALLFPMLEQYPEDTSLVSLANKKYFQVANLDEESNNLLKLNTINMKGMMMYP
jgi:hypothetical protein